MPSLISMCSFISIFEKCVKKEVHRFELLWLHSLSGTCFDLVLTQCGTTPDQTKLAFPHVNNINIDIFENLVYLTSVKDNQQVYQLIPITI